MIGAPIPSSGIEPEERQNPVTGEGPGRLSPTGSSPATSGPNCVPTRR
ncbi:hypothetical protein ACFQWF_13825 [Methylorubrum suomiense]